MQSFPVLPMQGVPSKRSYSASSYGSVHDLPGRNPLAPILVPRGPFPRLLLSLSRSATMTHAATQLAVGSGSAWAQAAIIAVVLIGAYVLAMWLAAVLWTWRDIWSRTHDGVSQAVCTALVAVF